MTQPGIEPRPPYLIGHWTVRVQKEARTGQERLPTVLGSITSKVKTLQAAVRNTVASRRAELALTGAETPPRFRFWRNLNAIEELHFSLFDSLLPHFLCSHLERVFPCWFGCWLPWQQYHCNSPARDSQEIEMAHWTIISCFSDTLVSPRPRPFRRPEAVLSPFILMGEMNVITDYDQFFCPIVTKIHIGPIFHETHIFWTFWH